MVALPSFAKINLGLKIGPKRPDRFHELRTIYQTVAIHDVIQVEVQRGIGVEIRCRDGRVPLDNSNTCHKIADRVMDATKSTGRVVVTIDKRLPVQGGVGAASSNAVVTMLALERALGVRLGPADKLRIAAEVGSDLPLFLIGGTVLGVGRGEEVFPLPDLPPMHVVLVTPQVGVSTPEAFARWDELNRLEAALTGATDTGTMTEFSRRVSAWLSRNFPQTSPSAGPERKSASGVPAVSGNRAETPLLDLVRAGIENDFERVVFPEHPDLREVKELLLREGAGYAALSGSGSSLYGLFASEAEAQTAAERMIAAGHKAIATRTLSRAEYWAELAAGTP